MGLEEFGRFCLLPLSGDTEDGGGVFVLLLVALCLMAMTRKDRVLESFLLMPHYGFLLLVENDGRRVVGCR